VSEYLEDVARAVAQAQTPEYPNVWADLDEISRDVNRRIARAAVAEVLDVEQLARLLWIHDTPPTHGVTSNHRRIAAEIRADYLGGRAGR